MAIWLKVLKLCVVQLLKVVKSSLVVALLNLFPYGCFSWLTCTAAKIHVVAVLF